MLRCRKTGSGLMVAQGMRATLFLAVLALHVALFFVFAVLSRPVPHLRAAWRAPAIAFFVTAEPATPRIDSAASAPTAGRAPGTPRSRAQQVEKRPEAGETPRIPPQNNAITPAPVPDWHHDLEVAANNQIESAEHRRREPSPLAPHDFSRVQPGSTDTTPQEFGWDHSATQRIQPMAGGGVLLNINDRCAIAWVIFPFPVCRIGKIPVRGDLFDHMKDGPQGAEHLSPGKSE